MKLKVEVSAGDLVDKISILEIKLERMSDPAQRTNVMREYSTLIKVMNSDVPQSDDLTRLRHELTTVNSILWKVEDDIRRHEKDGTFGAEFVALARAVYHTNTQRSMLKRQINDLLGSDLVEEKSYVAF